MIVLVAAPTAVGDKMWHADPNTVLVASNSSLKKSSPSIRRPRVWLTQNVRNEHAHSEHVRIGWRTLISALTLSFSGLVRVASGKIVQVDE
jgi:hypothetical protein